ncbi:MAG: hemolysin III family protein [Gammaproteobacteria bacterium]|nr:MAG: hemolysin III family protein [Gammaproteobacteria bacterium]RLA11983.1 MAG: hemolysin III family protein [Gammaproteobacteria bacterium]RLA13522.1 MAG: hemolysin III family protein [Gammaproteobacteria bacterium]
MYYGEKLNSISHLVGGVLALVGLGALLTVSIQTRDPLVIFAFSVYGFTLVLLYSMSTLYHSFYQTQLKRLFKLMDHIAIYLLIAGTYTPFMLLTLNDRNGYLILGLVWGLAVIGILSEIWLSGRAVKVGQLIIYLGMGWACSLDLGSIKAGLPGLGFFWLYMGGLAYTGGVFFYVGDHLKRLSHAHGIWHFFVLVGSICHFVSVIGFVR